jgi:surfeit locus 1 family protein
MIFRPLPILTIVTSVALAILIGLGFWQLERREEKHALLDQIAQRMIAPADSIEALLIDEPQAPFRHATAQGTFEHAQESYVFAPRSDDNGTRLGYKVITPLRLTASAIVLVDRGWVPQEKRAAATRLKGQIEGVVTIRGLLRPASSPGLFTPDPNVAEHIWYVHDIAAMAAAFGLKPATTLYLEASTPVAGGPEPTTEMPEIPDNHLQYALTWFALAFVLMVVYFVFHHSRGRLRFRR